MAINKKALRMQMLYIYKTQGIRSLITYFARAFNYLIINRYFRGSYSQKGEDLMIDKYFNHKKKGFYVDIGACHPKRLNNTKFFYNMGWHGINIEPNPTRIKLFLKDRLRDINLNMGIGTKTKKTSFYEFESAALSTFSEEEANSLLKVGYKLRRKVNIQMCRLADIMKEYVKSNIDFMTIDTEGLDMDVLESNDWTKYRPTLLCIETVDFIELLLPNEKKSTRKEDISNYLSSKGYQEYFSNGLNTLYNRDIKTYR